MTTTGNDDMSDTPESLGLRRPFTRAEIAAQRAVRDDARPKDGEWKLREARLADMENRAPDYADRER